MKSSVFRLCSYFGSATSHFIGPYGLNDKVRATFKNKLCHEGGFSSPHSAKDVQAGAALHVAYGDDLVCLHSSAKDDIGHGDRPEQENVLCSAGVSLQSFREIAMVCVRSAKDETA